MLLYDAFQHAPNLFAAALNESLCALYIMRFALSHKLVHYERLKKLKRHFLRQSALIHLELRSDDDNASSGIIHAFSEKILTETALFAAQQSGKRLKLAVSCARNGLAASAVVDKRVNGLLKHTFFVSYDNIGSGKLDKSFQTVVSGNDSAIQIIQIGGCESAAVKLNHRPKLRRKHGKNVHYHPRRIVFAFYKRVKDFKTLNRLDLLLSGRIVDDFADLLVLLFQIDSAEKLLYRLRAHADSE